MLRFSRPTTGLFAAAAFLSALTAWDRCADPNAPSPFEQVAGLIAPRRTGDAAREAALQADVVRRSRRLDEVVAEVRSGRLGLLEAAARVRDIQSASPFFPRDLFREGNAGDNDDERFCRMLINLSIPTPGAGPDSVVTRLEAELNDHLSRGPIRLPDASGGDNPRRPAPRDQPGDPPPGREPNGFASARPES
ncbi:MAG TPA: hypothetical protein VFW33_20250 [Gemmataceae bacterium]|nr:hypothetical protein [Gemmataceae bacterium]